MCRARCFFSLVAQRIQLQKRTVHGYLFSRNANPAGLPGRIVRLLTTGPAPPRTSPGEQLTSLQSARRRARYITEPIWDRLVTSMPFANLQQTLVASERNLRDLRVHGKVAFYLHLLRRVMWKAPITWLENTIRFLNEHHSIVEQRFDYDMEFVDAIFECRRSSDSSVTQRAGSEVHKMIREAIRRFCESDEIKGDRIVIGCQTRIANDSDGVLAAFACDAEEVDPLLIAWEFVSDDVAARQSEPETADQENMPSWRSIACATATEPTRAAVGGMCFTARSY